MPDEAVADFVDFLRDQKGPLARQIKRATVLMDQIERDNSPEIYDGEKYRMGVLLAPQQGGGFTTETGTLNTPQLLEKTKTRIDVGIAHVPVSFTTKLLYASDKSENAWMDAADKMEEAEKAFRDIINEAWCTDGDALVAAVTATIAASGVAAQTVNVGTLANWYELYEGRVVDVRVRSTGAVKATAVKITSFVESTGIITTTSSGAGYATDANDGIYVQGSWGNGIAGIGQMAATTGTFQEISRTTFPQWAGTDASPVAGTPLSISVLDRAERLVKRRSGDVPNFYIGDPAVIDKYGQGILVQSEWNGAEGTLGTGFEGIRYRKRLLIPEYAMPSRRLQGIPKKDLKILTLDDGPDWDERDGAMFKRFSRALPVEAWLVWMLQLATQRCNAHVTLQGLAQAA